MEHRPRGIAVVAMLMILFGLAEIVTAFRHHFFGISTAQSSVFSYAAAALGVCYALGGSLILTMRKWAAALAVALICADVAGRLALMATGLYPMNSPQQVAAIIIGTVIAVIFAIYIIRAWSLFR